MQPRMSKGGDQPPKPEFVCRFQKQETPRPRHFFEIPVVKHVASGLAIVAIGACAGYGMEAHTNEVARGKALTAQTCLDTTTHGKTVNEPLEKCFAEGVPGGDPIGKGRIHTGDPIEFVNTYIDQQHHEAKSVESYRVAGWALGGAAVYAAGSLIHAANN